MLLKFRSLSVRDLEELALNLRFEQDSLGTQTLPQAYKLTSFTMMG